MNHWPLHGPFVELDDDSHRILHRNLWDLYMSHGPLPAAKGPEKSTLDRKFKNEGECPFKGFRFQELSRDENNVTLKFYNGMRTVPLSDYLTWAWINVEA